jgi:hypothetical protein
MLAIHWYPKINLFFLNGKKKKLVDIGGPPIKCAYHEFIIQNLGVVTLELDMKVQFSNFWQIEHTKILVVHQ